MNEYKVNQAVEAICKTGCRSVNAAINTLESGHAVNGTEDFNKTEIAILTSELKVIMSVYESNEE